MNNSSLEISKACDEIKEMLLSKNMQYGDSALDPVRIFSNASSVEQLLVRIDDKISRIKRGAGMLTSNEDVIKDLTGYLVLLKVAFARENMEYDQNTKPGRDLYDEVVSFHSSPMASEIPMNSISFSQWDGTDIDNPKEFYCGDFAFRCPD